ncbi:ABC transporter permease [Streptomyces sp. NPDC001586]|uniref:ABC transporter permease n=1 Tax=Streptomyces sp. NPDC001586 TaxID=3154387 RepID=UPI003324D895
MSAAGLRALPVTAPPAAFTRPPATGPRAQLRAVCVVWHRDMLRLLAEPVRVATALLQPLLFLFALGGGLGSLTRSAYGVPYQTFVYAGALAMPVVFASIGAASSIVWDREFGFLREMLVAPVSRTAVVTGKCLGGMTTGLFQGTIVLALAGTVGVPYDLPLMLELFAYMALLAFTFSCFAVLVAARMRSVQSFMALTQMVVQPLFFLSGALFPLSRLPAWLSVATRFDPLTYAVDPIRRAVLGAVGATAAAPGVTWGRYLVPVWLELLLVLVSGTCMLWAASRTFRRG